MSDLSRLTKLAGHLQAEISAARAGDTQGQFPILDLIGNIRDEAGGIPTLKSLATLCAEAWERMVKIVESGQDFSAADIAWLKTLLAQVQVPGSPADCSSAAAAPAPLAPPPAPAATVATAVPPAPAPAPAPMPAPTAAAANEPDLLAEEAPLNLNLGEDTELLREFINESREHLDNIEQGVLVLENSPQDAEVLNTIFRAFHTFKGGAGFLNLIPINRLAHVLESLLDLARQGKMAIEASSPARAPSPPSPFPPPS